MWQQRVVQLIDILEKELMRVVLHMISELGVLLGNRTQKQFWIHCAFLILELLNHFQRLLEQ